MKVYDKKMSRRVHKLQKKLKYEINPKIQRELRIKYNTFKKESMNERINECISKQK